MAAVAQSEPAPKPFPYPVTGWVQDKAGHVDPSAMRLMAFQVGEIAPWSDLRKEMPEVYDQGSLGSCTGQGLAAIFDHAWRKYLESKGLRKRWLSPSRLFVYYEERVREGTIDEDAGAQIRTGIDVLAEVGVCRESRWPYRIERWRSRPPEKAYGEAPMYGVLHGYKLALGDGKSVRVALTSGRPVVFGALLYSGMGKITPRDTLLEMPRKGERPQGGHCMVIVGHDDAAKTYLVRNSWGWRWGDGGHFRMPYAYLNDRIAGDGWVVDAVGGLCGQDE